MLVPNLNRGTATGMDRINDNPHPDITLTSPDLMKGSKRDHGIGQTQQEKACGNPTEPSRENDKHTLEQPAQGINEETYQGLNKLFTPECHVEGRRLAHFFCCSCFRTCKHSLLPIFFPLHHQASSALQALLTKLRARTLVLQRRNLQKKLQSAAGNQATEGLPPKDVISTAARQPIGNAVIPFAEVNHWMRT